MNYPKAFLKKGKERNLLLKHPWVFSGAVQSYEKEPEDGEIFEICSNNREFLAIGYYGTASIAFRILTFEKQEINQRFFCAELQNIISYREQINLWKNPETNIFRLIHGEGDHLPGLIVDIYGRNMVIHAHSTGIKNLRTLFYESVEEVCPGLFDTIYFNFQEKVNVNSGSFLKGNTSEGTFMENNHSFYVNWVEGQKTGFFIDQRDNRQLLQRYSQHKKVLNTFCYSGGFSVYAALAGAKEIHSTDVSSKAIQWTKKNFEFLSSDSIHTTFVMDSFRFLKECDHDYDVIILDPPAFTKHIRTTPQAMIGYRNLNEAALRKIKKGGVLFTFSCSQAVDKSLFKKIVFQAAIQAKRKVRIMHYLSQGADHPINIFHPEGEYLKGLVVYVE